MYQIDQVNSATVTVAIPQRRPSFMPPATMRVRVTALACGAVRVTRTMREAFLDRASDVVINAAPGGLDVLETPESYSLLCGDIIIRIAPDTGALAFYNREGTPLLREDEKRPCQLEEKTVIKNRFKADGVITMRQSVDGVRASAEDYESYEDRKAYTCRQNFVFDNEEGLYGLGSHEEGFGNLRGKTQALYQHNMKAVVPVLVSTKGWGLLFDLGCLMTFHDDAEGSYLWADCADEMDYYFMGAGYDKVMAEYMALTGAAPLMPRYAFGYIQSKERYKDAQELIDVVKEYRKREIPLDVIVLDWCSWPEGQWGYKHFDESRFPDPAALTETLHRLGAKMMISIWPSFQGDANQDRKEMLENDKMLGNNTIYNAFDKGARALYWKQARDGLFRYGVDAWWCDCSEPFESDWRGTIKPEPHERVLLNTAEAKKYLDPAAINCYSLYHSQGIYEGQRQETEKKRVVNLTRSSYAGQHRYATITWSGDVSSTWEVLRRQVPDGLNFCATGENYWTTDAGGFFPMNGGAWFGQGDFNKGVDDLGYRELFVRWMQYAAFLPMMRAHGTGTPREIWRFGEKGEPFYDAIAKAIRFRSALVPYLYSLAALYTQTGLPMLRVPALMFPKDSALRNIGDEMLLGDALLVKPVTRPMYYLPESKPIPEPDITVPVYLPAGADWYDFITGERYTGGQWVTAEAPLDAVPLFVRAGSLLPIGPVTQYAGQPTDGALIIRLYPGADGAFTLYEDAGDGYGYERGEWTRLPMIWQEEQRCLTLGQLEGSYPGVSSKRKLIVRLPNGDETVLRYDGVPVQLNI